MSNEEQYEIQGEEGKLFHVLAVNDLENLPKIEEMILAAGFDGYAYALQNVDPKRDFERYNCFKLIDGPFIKIPELKSEG